jgi:hypothetical protein
LRGVAVVVGEEEEGGAIDCAGGDVEVAALGYWGGEGLVLVWDVELG